MRWQSRVKYFIDRGMRSQPFCNGLRIATMLLYPQMKCFDTAYHQPAIKWRKYGTACILNELYFFANCRIFCYNESGYEIAMSTKIFCCAVHYNISSQ